MGVILFIGAVLLYFLPSMVGYNKKNAGSIIILNIFLGWTLIGWVVALVWAASVDSDQAPPPSFPHTHSVDRIGKLKDLKSLLDEGAITQSEFNREKEKILNQ